MVKKVALSVSENPALGPAGSELGCGPPGRGASPSDGACLVRSAASTGFHGSATGFFPESRRHQAVAGPAMAVGIAIRAGHAVRPPLCAGPTRCGARRSWSSWPHRAGRVAGRAGLPRRGGRRLLGQRRSLQLTEELPAQRRRRQRQPHRLHQPDGLLGRPLGGGHRRDADPDERIHTWVAGIARV